MKDIIDDLDILKIRNFCSKKKKVKRRNEKASHSSELENLID